MKKYLMLAFLAALGLLTACNDANVVSANLSAAADNFKVQRRITFYAAIPMVGVVNLLSIEGLCSLGNQDATDKVTITCKIAAGGDTGSYLKHIQHLGAGEGYTIEQTKGLGVSPYHYKMIFKPEAMVPSFEVR